MKKITLIFCACIILIGCNRTPKVDILAEADAIRNLENQWLDANIKKDVDKALTFFSSDAILIEPETPVCEGLQSIKELWGSMATDTTFMWDTYSGTIDKIEVAASGDLAYVRGITRMKIKTTDGLSDYTARWVEVWKKYDGQWKAMLVIANS